MKRATLILAAVALLLGSAEQAKAGVLYDNGPINGNLDAWFIDTFAVSDSFTLTQSAQLTGAQVGLWVNSGATPTSVTWTISTGPVGDGIGDGNPPTGIIASGTATNLTNNFNNSNGFGFDVYETSFSLSATLSAGTYYLTLGPGATESDGGRMAWDENNGPSSAYHSTLGNLADADGSGGTGSESFQILGNASAVPEPASLTLLGFGIAGLAGYGWRRRKQQAANA